MSANDGPAADEVSFDAKRGEIRSQTSRRQAGDKYGRAFIGRRRGNEPSGHALLTSCPTTEPETTLWLAEELFRRRVRFSSPAFGHEQLRFFHEPSGGIRIFYALKRHALVADAVRHLRDPRICVGHFRPAILT